MRSELNPDVKLRFSLFILGISETDILIERQIGIYRDNLLTSLNTTFIHSSS